ncbi:MAG: FHA domain-containing protein [Methylococcales bacterium]|nr:FHA domain-containing protein [Methylococcales bacterium]
MKNDTQTTSIEKLKNASSHLSTNDQINPVSKEKLVQTNSKNTVADNQRASTYRFEKKSRMIDTNFEEIYEKLEKKIADISGSKVSTIPNTPSTNWSTEKTILINNDISASLVRLDTKQEFFLGSFPFYIGRAENCQLQLEDMTLSRKHAKIQKTESGISIEDLESSNGIKVNGINVDKVLLMNGDIIKLSKTKLRFTLNNPTQPKQKARQITYDFLERIDLTYPNWKIVSTFGLVGMLFVGTYLYISQVSSHEAITEKLTRSETSSQAQTEQAITPTLSIIESEHTDNSTPNTETNIPTQQVSKIQNITKTNVLLKQEKQSLDINDSTATQTSSVPKKVITPTPPIFKSEPKYTDSSISNTETNTPTQQVSNTQNIVSKNALLEQEKQSLKNDDSNNQKPVKNKVFTLIPSTGSTSVLKKSLESKIIAKTTKPTERLTIHGARQYFLKGDDDKAINMLTNLSTNSRLSAKLQHKASLLRAEIVTLKNFYQKGLSAYNSGDKDQAWDSWASFIITEKKLNLSSTSQHFKHIQARAVKESLFAKQSATQNTPSSLNTSSQSTFPTLAVAEEKIRNLYKDGYRLEHSNLPKAIERWKDVINLASSNSVYYTKAKAKLRFYKEMNR